REMELPLYCWQRRRQIAGLFLAEMVARLDRERQHLDQRSGRIVVDQLGSNRSPVRGYKDALLCHCRSDQSECDDESSKEKSQHSAPAPFGRPVVTVSGRASRKRLWRPASPRTRRATP